MIVFEVRLNGEKLAVAGAEDLASLTCDVTAIGKLGPLAVKQNKDAKDVAVWLSVNGVTARKDTQDEYLRWVLAELKVGDEVVVDLMESASADRPRETFHAEDLERNEYESAREQYFKLRDKYESGLE